MNYESEPIFAVDDVFVAADDQILHVGQKGLTKLEHFSCEILKSMCANPVLMNSAYLKKDRATRVHEAIMHAMLLLDELKIQRNLEL